MNIFIYHFSHIFLFFFFVTGIVVQNDLVDALKNGTIFAAGLDVMVPEPLPADDILTKLPNCGKHTFSGCFFFIFCLLACFAHFNFFCCCFCFLLLFVCASDTVLIPHLGSAAVQTRDDMATVAVQNILNMLDGKSPIYSAY